MKLDIDYRFKAQVPRADVIVAALSPDNVGIPEGLELQVSSDEGEITVHLHGRSEIGEFERTWNDLAVNLKTAIDTVSSLRGDDVNELS